MDFNAEQARIKQLEDQLRHAANEGDIGALRAGLAELEGQKDSTPGSYKKWGVWHRALAGAIQTGEIVAASYVLDYMVAKKEGISCDLMFDAFKTPEKKIDAKKLRENQVDICISLLEKIESLEGENFENEARSIIQQLVWSSRAEVLEGILKKFPDLVRGDSWPLWPAAEKGYKKNGAVIRVLIAAGAVDEGMSDQFKHRIQKALEYADLPKSQRPPASA